MSTALTIAQIVSNSPCGHAREISRFCSQKAIHAFRDMLKTSGSPGAFSFSE